MALIRVINYKLEVAKNKKFKIEKIVEKEKTKALTAKHHKNRGRISLFSKEKKNYESDIRDNMNLDQANTNIYCNFKLQ